MEKLLQGESQKVGMGAACFPFGISAITGQNLTSEFLATGDFRRHGIAAITNEKVDTMSKVVAFELDDGTVVPLMIECPECFGTGKDFSGGWWDEFGCCVKGKVRNPALNWEWRCSGPLGGGVLYLQDTHECKLNGGEHGSHCRWVALGLTP